MLRATFALPTDYQSLDRQVLAPVTNENAGVTGRRLSILRSCQRASTGVVNSQLAGLTVVGDTQSHIPLVFPECHDGLEDLVLKKHDLVVPGFQAERLVCRCSTLVLGDRQHELWRCRRLEFHLEFESLRQIGLMEEG